MNFHIFNQTKVFFFRKDLLIKTIVEDITYWNDLVEFVFIFDCCRNYKRGVEITIDVKNILADKRVSLTKVTQINETSK